MRDCVERPKVGGRKKMEDNRFMLHSTRPMGAVGMGMAGGSIREGGTERQE